MYKYALHKHLGHIRGCESLLYTQKGYNVASYATYNTRSIVVHNAIFGGTIEQFHKIHRNTVEDVFRDGSTIQCIRVTTGWGRAQQCTDE